MEHFTRCEVVINILKNAQRLSPTKYVTRDESPDSPNELIVNTFTVRKNVALFLKLGDKITYV